MATKKNIMRALEPASKPPSDPAKDARHKEIADKLTIDLLYLFSNPEVYHPLLNKLEEALSSKTGAPPPLETH